MLNFGLLDAALPCNMKIRQRMFGKIGFLNVFSLGDTLIG
jgi:hypothetical protein